MKKLVIFLVFFIGTNIIIMSQIVTGVAYSGPTDQINVSGPYLGQDPPGMTAKRFPPDSLLGNSQWWWHGSPMFTPDGLEMFWSEYVRYSASYEQIVMFTMKVENDNWGPVHKPFFGDTLYMDNNPLFSPGGDTLYFFSSRPGGPFFRVTRTDTGWTQPVSIQIPKPAGTSWGLEFSVNRNGDFFVELSSPATAPPDIYVSRFQNGQYQMAQKLGNEVNSPYLDGFPFVDPDEEYLIFASNRPGGFGGQFDMYICFKNEDSTWTDAMNMGYKINSTGAWFGSVTLDKQYLFFNTARPPDQGYNPYWISAAIIDSLHLIVSLKEPVKSYCKAFLFQNEPNPYYNQTRISFELVSEATITLDIIDQMGKLVRQLVKNQVFNRGKHILLFDASGLTSGIYLYKLTPDNGSPLVRKMLIQQ